MKTLSYTLTTVLLLLLLFTTSVKAINNDPTGYPYKNSPKGQVDQWSFYTRYCTSYAAYRADEILGNFHNNMTGPNGKTGKFDHAHNWENNAKNLGFVVTTTPTEGAIVVWEPGAGDSGSVGHVAYVESVNANNTFNISEYNWNYGDGNYNYRPNLTKKPGTSFVILKNGTNTCTPPTSGNWTINDKSCTLTSSKKVTGDLILNGNSTLKIQNGATLDMDLKNIKILVKDSSKLIIENNSKIK